MCPSILAGTDVTPVPRGDKLLSLGCPPCWDTLRCEANPWRLKLWQQTQNWGAPSWSEVEFALESLLGPGFSALCPLSTPEGETKF